MYCKECSSCIPDEASFCPSCGAPVEEDFDATGLLMDDDNDSDATGLLDYDEATGLLDNNDYDEATGLLIEDEPIMNITEDALRNDRRAHDDKSYEVYEKEILHSKTENVNSAYVNPNFVKTQNQQNNAYQVQSGAPTIQGAYQQPTHTNQSVGTQIVQNSQMSYLEFFESFASKKTKNNVKTVGIICIVTAVVSLGLLSSGSYVSAIDFLVYLIFGILVLKKKSFTLTLPVCIYGVIFTIIGVATSGIPAGVFASAMSILAVINLKKIDSAYKEYLSTKQTPQTEI